MLALSRGHLNGGIDNKGGLDIRFSIDIHEYPRTSMDIPGYPWLLMSNPPHRGRGRAPPSPPHHPPGGGTCHTYAGRYAVGGPAGLYCPRVRREVASILYVAWPGPLRMYEQWTARVRYDARGMCLCTGTRQYPCMAVVAAAESTGWLASLAKAS